MTTEIKLAELDITPEALMSNADNPQFYPSASRREALEISTMHPMHAYNAWAKCRDAAGARWPVYMLRPLPMSLLRQALGGDSYQRLIAEAEFKQRPNPEQLLAVSYIALNAMVESRETNLFKQAGILASLLSQVNWEE